MTHWRWRFAGWAAVAVGAIGPLAVARWAGVRYERAFAVRAAETAAAYLSVVTPRAMTGPDLDLAQLLVNARSLATLPGWAGTIEVYRGTAPLVDATAPLLDPVTLARMRRQEAARWHRGVALAPLKDKDDWDVVGAVGIRPAGSGWIGRLFEWGWTLPALLLTVALGWGTASGRRFRWYAAATAVLALASYADARAAARRSTDRWLTATRVLMQEARRAGAGMRELARLAHGAEVVEGESAGAAPRRRTVGGVRWAVVAVRLGARRWLELRTVPAEALTVGWLGLAIGLASLGPLGLWVAGWAERAALGQPQQLRETVAAWGFLAPAALHLAVFAFGPILFALYLSVHRWGLVERTRPFVGLANYGAVLRDPLVWISLGNTLLYSLYVPISMAVALAVAVALNRSSRAARVARTVFCLPYVSSVVAVALVWQWMFHADLGLLNHLLSYVGLGPFDWLGSPKTALLAVMILSIWVQVGYQMVVFLAGLQAIPQSYLDAATIDGASAWRRFWRVTFPLLRPVTLFVLVTGVIGSFQVFTYIYVLTDGGPLHATDVVVYRIYQTGWEFLQFGQASALSLLLFALLFGVTWAQFRLLGARIEYA